MFSHNKSHPKNRGPAMSDRQPVTRAGRRMTVPGPTRCRVPGGGARRARLGLEVLEDRLMPSTFGVGGWSNEFTAGSSLGFYSNGNLVLVNTDAQSQKTLTVGGYTSEFNAGNNFGFYANGILTVVNAND
jgi:hypothetical protein